MDIFILAYAFLISPYIFYQILLKFGFGVKCWFDKLILLKCLTLDIIGK